MTDQCPHCLKELKLAHSHGEGNALAYGDQQGQRHYAAVI